MAEIIGTVGTDDTAFVLGAKFNVQESTSTPFKQFKLILKSTGDYACSNEYDKGVNYTEKADYCDGGSPSIAADLAALLSAFGQVGTTAVALATKVSVHFAAGLPAEVTVDGHQHDVNPHLTATLKKFDVSSIIPAASGKGVPTLITVTGDVTPVDATVEFSFEHKDHPGATGDHWGAVNLTGKATLSVTYEGIPATVTAGSWLNIILAPSKTNQDIATATLTAERYIDAA